MPKTKSKPHISTLSIIFKGLKTYFYNLDIFAKYLAFPVLGMALGIFILFGINYFYVTNLDNLQAVNPIFENISVVLTLILVLTIPGFLIFTKAFWDYIIAYGTLNSMCVIGEKRIEDIKSHKETIKMRIFSYCRLIILLSLIFFIFIIPPLIFLAILFLSLAIQVFVLEENTTPFEAIKKSFLIVKNNIWTVFWVLVLITVISYWFIPYLISWAFVKLPFFNYFTYPVERYLSLLPIDDINSVFASYNIDYKFDIIIVAEDIVKSIVSSIIVMFMLPFRCACCVELYKAFRNDISVSEEDNSQKIKENKRTKKGKK